MLAEYPQGPAFLRAEGVSALLGHPFSALPKQPFVLFSQYGRCGHIFIWAPQGWLPAPLPVQEGAVALQQTELLPPKAFLNVELSTCRKTPWRSKGHLGDTCTGRPPFCEPVAPCGTACKTGLQRLQMREPEQPGELSKHNGAAGPLWLGLVP